MEKNQIQLYDSNYAIDVKRTAWNALSEESQKAYQSDFNIFFDFVKKDIKKVTANDLLDYIEYLRKNEYKANSINRKTAALSKMFKIMIYAGEIKQNPVETLKQFKNISMKVNKEIRISLTMNDIRKAIKKGQKQGQNKQVIMIIRLLAMTGLRISELINIKNTDIKNYDKSNLIVRVIGKGRKERFIYLPKNIKKEIDILWPKMVYLLYTRRKTPYDRRVLWAQITEFFQATIGKPVHPHLLRHVFATFKINTEKQDIHAVSKFLGHQSISTTLEFYCDTALDVKSCKVKI